MTSKTQPVPTARNTASRSREALSSRERIERTAEKPASSDELLILLAQQIQARRKPARYLEGWIRRFVRG